MERHVNGSWNIYIVYTYINESWNVHIVYIFTWPIHMSHATYIHTCIYWPVHFPMCTFLHTCLHACMHACIQTKSVLTYRKNLYWHTDIICTYINIHTYGQHKYLHIFVLTSPHPSVFFSCWNHHAWMHLCLQVSVYVCMQTRIDTCIRVCMHALTSHACMHTCMHVRVYVYMQTRIYTYIYMCACIYCNTSM